ncbi:MAG: hypothetical protein FWG68_07670, partial [Defluviitaleaceae bacterium]|nr:hypothetical protein [Defluviitaleaceae bacterium]
EEVSEIIAFFNERFEEFREDKEVKDVMSFWEELLEEREYIAKLEGNTEGEIRTLYMRLKMTIKEIAKELSLTDDYVTKVLQEKGLLG